MELMIVLLVAAYVVAGAIVGAVWGRIIFGLIKFKREQPTDMHQPMIWSISKKNKKLVYRYK